MTRIYVSRATVEENDRVRRPRDPVIAVMVPGLPIAYTNRVEIQGPSTVVYDFDNPLKPANARVWIETEAPVVLHAGE